MKGSANISQGRRGETQALEYLIKKGYKIIDRNFRTRNGEIDLIGIQNNVLVFIEVKTRTSQDFGIPFEAITYYKMKALIRVAQYYKMTHSKLPEQMRIDAVSVQLNDFGMSTIEHVENISGF
ncbi:MAG: YraN family protein [Candidatus Levyibacteriota bacterium]